MVVKLYYSSTSGNVKISKEQQRIESILSSKKYAFEKIDIAQTEEDKQKMRDLMGNPAGVAPQLFNDDTYLGDYEKFDEAVECGELDKFLQTSPES